ncbi:MAG: hypothetical protein GF418_08360, partial [Chitinivibrionales bacterium]|nr:hypothetical protein [Chitinivibrionales bacterium]MBD3395626.1 hypothetical protein [Chitinivibrionales bacterium]
MRWSLCLLPALVSVALAPLADTLATPFLDGPDGTRWIVPYLLLMGMSFSIFGAIAMSLPAGSRSVERISLLGISIFFLATVVFVAGQRLTSGLRELEAFHEAGCIRIARGISLYGDGSDNLAGTYYPPLMYLIGGMFHYLAPYLPGYGRVVSLCSVLVSVYFVFRQACARFSSSTAGLWSAALFLATYGIMAKMYDWGLIDSL